MTKTSAERLVVCIDNSGYGASLDTRKIYMALHDAAAETQNMLRVIDGSGEDYLYDKTLFRSLSPRLLRDPRFLKRIEQARNSLRAGRGVAIEDVDIE